MADVDGWSVMVAGFEASMVEDEKSPNTIASYRDDLARFAAWYRAQYGSDPEVGNLGASELRAWKTHLSEERGQAPASVNRRLAALRSLSKWAQARKGSTPIPVPKSLREEARRPRWLSRKEQHALVRSVERSRDRRSIAIVALLLHAGLRIDELARLTWGQITLSERKGSVDVTGKGRKRRQVPLNVEARNALLELDGRQPSAGSAPVIQGQRGPMTRKGIQKVVDAIGESARLEGFSAHVLRHTFCKRLAEAGVRLEEIASLAGHESLDTTRRYVEPGQEELAAAVERLAGGAE